MSSDPKEQELGETLADTILNAKTQKEFSELEELKVKTNRTIINKCPINENTSDPTKMGQGNSSYKINIMIRYIIQYLS